MVTEKNMSSSIGTFTRAAVMMKKMRMKTKLPAILIPSEILKHK